MEIAENELDEKLYLTVQEAAEALLMSQASVYSWVERGRLDSEELPSGKVIVISKKDVEKIRKINLKSRRNRVSKQNIYNVEFSSENSDNLLYFTENSEELQSKPDPRTTSAIPENYSKLQDSLELAKLISELSAKAGKYELLSDLQRQNSDSAEFWKNEFFRLQSENNELKVENTLLKKQLEKKRGGIFGSMFRKRSIEEN